MGVMAGCSHRVVSERTRIGMPEITIALSLMSAVAISLTMRPALIGRFFIPLRTAAADALFANLGDVFLAHEQRHDVMAALAAAEWTTDLNAYNGVDGILNDTLG